MSHLQLAIWCTHAEVSKRMSAKAAKAVKVASGKKATLKAALDKVIHGPIMATNIPAGMASAGPPLGTMLGQRNINIQNFVKDFNERTKNIKEGTPMMTRVHCQPDRSYILEIFKPPTTYLLKQAAGIKRGSMQPGNTFAGIVSIKHVYEIAKFKNEELNCAHLSLKKMCISVLNAANRCGIKVVKHDLDPVELGEFLEQRKEIEKKEIAEVAEKRAAKMMRSAAAAAAASQAAAATPAKK